jgi:chemotaxis response regulator CheB
LSDRWLNVYSTDLGEEGVDLAKLYDYDIILLDLNLPDMTGHEVLRQLRNTKSGVKTPILILSGWTIRGQAEGLRLRRRRLPDQAVPPGGAGRAHPRHHPPQPRAMPSRSSTPARSRQSRRQDRGGGGRRCT